MLDAVKEVFADPQGRQLIHEVFAANCFNKCWTFFDKADRTDEDTEDMLLVAQTSLWHWKQRTDCEPVNLSVGYWQISRAYALAENAPMALQFARKCLAVSESGKLSPFFLGYAHEALARADLLAGNTAAAKGHLADAQQQLAAVANKDEIQLLGADLTDLDNALADDATE